MGAPIWANNDKDGDRHIKRRAGEYHGNVEQIARNLRDLARVRDADSSRVQRVAQAAETAERLREQLKSLHND